jgi:hypothetical protein
VSITPENVRGLLEAATPGPWQRFVDHVGTDELYVARALRLFDGDRVLANAELIAAAPEIAQAYLELVDILERMGVRWAAAVEQAQR